MLIVWTWLRADAVCGNAIPYGVGLEVGTQVDPDDEGKSPMIMRTPRDIMSREL